MSLLLRVPQPIWAGSFKLLSVNLDHLPPQTCACNCNNSSLFFNLIKAFSSLLVHPARLLIPSFCLLICSSRQSAGIGSNVITFAYPNQPPPDLSCSSSLRLASLVFVAVASRQIQHVIYYLLLFDSSAKVPSFSFHFLLLSPLTAIPLLCVDYSSPPTLPSELSEELRVATIPISSKPSL